MRRRDKQVLDGLNFRKVEQENVSTINAKFYPILVIQVFTDEQWTEK